jgi:hypothetical protein
MLIANEEESVSAETGDEGRRPASGLSKSSSISAQPSPFTNLEYPSAINVIDKDSTNRYSKLVIGEC